MGRDPRRQLTVEERRAAYDRAGGLCQNCGGPLGADYHNAHLAARSNGGPTSVDNIEPQCPNCNLINGSADLEEVSDITLRSWQEAALPVILERIWQTGVATVNAAPGAGKTYFALAVFAALYKAGHAERMIVVAPNLVIIGQWVEKGGKMRIHLDVEPRDGHLEHPDTVGASISYQLLPKKVLSRTVADMHRERLEAIPTFVVLDEVHHIADKKSWGQAVAAMVGDVANGIVHPTAVLNMTGTLFRSGKDKRISTVRYDTVLDEDGVEKLKAQADWSISTAELIGHELRPPDLYVYNTRAQLMDTRNDTVVEGDLGDLDQQQRSTALRGLDKSPEWLRGYVSEALRLLDNQLAAVNHEEPLKLLYCANDIPAARLAADAINDVMGRDFARLIVSDEKKAKKALEDAAKEPNPCAIVQVRMASEGFDCPQVSTIAYASTVTADLSIAQMMARAMRITDHERASGQLLPAQILIPNDPALKDVFSAVLSPLPKLIDLEDDDCPVCERPLAECVCPCQRCGRPKLDCICPPPPPPPRPRYEVMDLSRPEFHGANVLGHDDGEVTSSELDQALGELTGLGIPVPYHPRVVVWGRRHSTAPARRYAPTAADPAPAPEPKTPTVTEANPRELNRMHRARLSKAAGWAKVHIGHDSRYVNVAQFQYFASDAADIPKGGRDQASTRQLEICFGWMRDRVVEHCRQFGEEVPSWAQTQ